MIRSIVIRNVDTDVTRDDIAKAAAALQRQVLEDFFPAWGEMAAIRAETPDDPARPEEWLLELRQVPTIDGALGFHDETASGTPLLYVFPALCAEDGVSWTSCASHEILEALADPLLTWCCQLPDGRIAALEVCDQVEGDGYAIDGVAVSNFNTPENYAPPKNLDGVKFDHLGLQTSAFEVRPQGYAQVFDPSGGWTQLGEQRAYRRKVADLGLSRGKRRGT